MDPTKLKVVELRAELAARGLDQKGVKAVLVDRLQQALDEEGGAEELLESIGFEEKNQSTNRAPPDDNEEDPNDNEEDHNDDEDDIENEEAISENVENMEMYEIKDETEIEEVLDEEKEEVKEEVDETEAKEEPEEKKVEVDESLDNEKDEDKSTTDKDASKNDRRRSTQDDKKNRKRQRSRSPQNRRDRDRRSPQAPQVRNPPAQNNDDFTKEEEEPTIDDKAVLLSWYDSDLHLEIDPDFENAKPLSDAALSLVWGGARCTHGVKSGRILYEVQITGHNQFYNNFKEEKNVFEMRCGWSTLQTDLQLGESPLSYAYDSIAKKATNNEFTDYGIRYGLDDIIGVYLDLDSTPCTIEYTVNGKTQGVAFEFDKSDLKDEALFPHIISKNSIFRVNFGQIEGNMLKFYKPKSDKKKSEGGSRRSRRDQRTESRRSKHESDKKLSTEKKSETDKLNETKKEEEDKLEKTDDKQTDMEEKDESKDENNADSEKNGDEKVTETPADESQAEDVEMKEVSEETKTETKPEVKEDEKVDNEEDKLGEETTKDEEATKNEEEKKEPLPILELLENYIYINKVPEEELVPGIRRPESRQECEVIMMVGLPGAGKTYWALNHAKENPDKHFNILGNQSLIDRMKILGEPRKKCHVGRWERLIEWCTRTLIVLQDIATRRRRNFILDQTNVYASAQRRKMRGFGEFKRTAVVVIPEEEEYKQRFDKKIENDGKEVSETTVNEMKANFALPTTEYGWFTEIKYSDLDGEAAQKAVEEYNEKGKKALPPPQPASKRRRFDDRNRRDNRRDNRFQRWSGNDRRPARGDRWGSGGGVDRRSSGYDRRDRWGGSGGGSSWSSNRRGLSRYDDRDRGLATSRDRDRRDFRDRTRNRSRSIGRDDKKRDSRRLSVDRSRNGSSSNWGSGSGGNWGSSNQWGSNNWSGGGYGNGQGYGGGGQPNWNSGWGGQNWSGQWSTPNVSSGSGGGQWKNYGTNSSSVTPANQNAQWMNYWQ